MSNPSKERNVAFDAAKALAILLVLWGHTIQYCGHPTMTKGTVYTLIYTFHMPLFMMVAGFFSKSSLTLKFASFFKKNITHLLLPVITGCLFVMCLSLMTGFFIGVGVFITHYWFLKSLFICYVLTWITINATSLFAKQIRFQILIGGG